MSDYYQEQSNGNLNFSTSHAGVLLFAGFVDSANVNSNTTISSMISNF
jgi:hypothetical protein